MAEYTEAEYHGIELCAKCTGELEVSLAITWNDCIIKRDEQLNVLWEESLGKAKSVMPEKRQLAWAAIGGTPQTQESNEEGWARDPKEEGIEPNAGPNAKKRN